jgi:hypothetical protein
VVLLCFLLAACQTETIEVTRIKILERRVIERVPVTVEVTRLYRVVETPKPTADDVLPPLPSPEDDLTPTASPATPTPTRMRPTAAATEVPGPSNAQPGQDLLAAVKGTEQTLLALVQALNSNPLPTDQAVQLYNTLQAAPTFTISDGATELGAYYIRYREQVDYVLAQGTDLYNHLLKIQTGEADQTQVSPTHLALAQEAASTGTSALQALLRELEGFLDSAP